MNLNDNGSNNNNNLSSAERHKKEHLHGLVLLDILRVLENPISWTSVVVLLEDGITTEERPVQDYFQVRNVDMALRYLENKSGVRIPERKDLCMALYRLDEKERQELREILILNMKENGKWITETPAGWKKYWSEGWKP